MYGLQIARVLCETKGVEDCGNETYERAHRRGEAKEGSDIDLLVIASGSLDKLEVLSIGLVNSMHKPVRLLRTLAGV